MKSYFKLIRIHHSIKNFLIFTALACSGQLFDFSRLSSAVIGFFSFCFISSAIYIINDIRDVDKDKLHPTKRFRPIASGAISIKNAYLLFIVLIILSLICNFFVYSRFSTIILVLYFLLNVAYSFGLKDIPIIDITILVSGFLFRVIYGAIITDIVVSNWLYLTVIAVAFYFALGKRRNELKKINSNGETRKVLKSYPESFLDKNMYMCLSLANVFYALWSTSERIISSYGQWLIITVPIVLLITMKYSMNLEGESDGDPVEVLLHDKILLVLCLVYLLAMFFIIYF